MALSAIKGDADTRFDSETRASPCRIQTPALPPLLAKHCAGSRAGHAVRGDLSVINAWRLHAIVSVLLLNAPVVGLVGAAMSAIAFSTILQRSESQMSEHVGADAYSTALPRFLEFSIL